MLVIPLPKTIDSSGLSKPKLHFMTNYKNLEAWKRSMSLVKDIYLLVKNYPKDELYGLTSQTKRAAVSIPCNIAEGSGRNTDKDTVQFLYTSRGSMYELETLLNIAVMVEIISEAQFQEMTPKIDECMRILNGLITYYENKEAKQAASKQTKGKRK
jgi:four helix bundle protein